MNLSIIIIVFVILTACSYVRGANILFYFAASGYSHRIGAWPIIEKLADSGHKVTFLSPFPVKNPTNHENITDFVPPNLDKDLGVIGLDFIGLRLREGVTAIDDLWNLYYKLSINTCDALMHKPEFLQWANQASFDVVIINAHFNECGYGLVHKFKAKHILYTPTSAFMWYKDAFGLSDENYPELQFHPPANMSFLQSVKNELVSLFWQVRRHTETFPRIEKMLRKGLEIPDLPNLDAVEMNTSLIFTYTHPSEEYPRSLPPNFVQIGGMHCNDDRKPLPPDLENFINSSGENGFILLSFGTHLAISNLPKYLQQIFFGAIAKVPEVKFIVKFNGDPPENLPKNVKTVQWIPQQDVIAHPKIKGFIGHGGLLGTQEAIWHGVPMIVIPLFVEQDFQAMRAHGRQTAIALEISELTEENLLNAIREILNNKMYKDNTVKLSKYFKDRQTKPVDTAVWWIEYVLRHDEIFFLRPIGVTRTWYERRMLHIWLFLFCLAIFALLLAASIAYFCLRVVIMQFHNKKPKLE